MRRDLVIQAAYFAVIATTGEEPTRRSIAEMVRCITKGKGIRDSEIGAWLKSRAPNGLQVGQQRAPEFSRKIDNPAPERPEPGTLHVRVAKVLESETKEIPSVSPETVLMDLGLPSVPSSKPVEKPTKPKKAAGKPREPSAADLAAYRLLDAFWARMGPLEGITVKDWKSRNKGAAISMLDSGVSADDWLAFWDESAQAGFRYLRLDRLQEGYGRRSARQNFGPASKPDPTDDYVDYTFARFQAV